ncbi:MAG: MATE family efflux transporter [Muribaculaceae bacterium]|nr:MATE family efflux transporter [Muribaculaceae bacterium]
MVSGFFLKKDGIDKEIVRLTVPTVLSNISVPLLAMCDTAVAGHMGSEKYLAGIAIGSMMMSTVFWLFSFLRAGTSGLTASAFGASDRGRMAYALMRSLALGIVMALAVAALQTPILSLFKPAVGATEATFSLAARYFSIAMWGAVPMMVLTAVSGWFVGMQSTKSAMTVNIAMSALNVAFTLLLVYGAGMGYDGIPLGTVASQWVILIPTLWLARRLSRRNGLAFSFDARIFFDPQEWRMMFGVNSNLFFRSACLIAVSMSIYTFSARLGDVAVSANAVINQLFLFFSYFMDGFAYTGEAVVGRWHGAGDFEMLRRYVRALLRWSAVVTVVFSLFYLVALPVLTSLLSDSEAVAASVEECRIWVVLIPMAGAAAFIFDGFYIGLTRTRPMLISTLFGVALFLTLLIFVARSPWMLWMAFTCYLALRSMILMILFPSNLKKT